MDSVEFSTQTSPRTIRQVQTYRELLPKLRDEGVVLAQVPGITDLTLLNASRCQGAGFAEAAELLNSWILDNDYESLVRHLTDPAESNEQLRVVSPLISVFGRSIRRPAPRISREHLSTPILR